MRPVQDFVEFEKNDTWWNQSNVEEYHRNMTKVVQYGQTIHPTHNIVAIASVQILHYDL